MDNKPGAGTNVAMRALIDSPDGPTLMLVVNAVAANPRRTSRRPFDTQRDLTPVLLVGVPVVIAVCAGAGWESAAQLIAQSRAKPGSPNWHAGQRRHRRTWRWNCSDALPASRLTHVPYKGGSQAITDVLVCHILYGGERTGGAAARSRQAARADGVEPAAHAHLPRRAQHRRKRLSRFQKPRSGTAWWARPGCHPPW